MYNIKVKRIVAAAKYITHLSKNRGEKVVEDPKGRKKRKKKGRIAAGFSLSSPKRKIKKTTTKDVAIHVEMERTSLSPIMYRFV